MRYCFLLCQVRQDNRIGDTAGIYDLLQEYSSRKHPDSNVYRCGNERYVKKDLRIVLEKRWQKSWSSGRSTESVQRSFSITEGKSGKTPFELVKEEKEYDRDAG